jgi:hypothetical protein
MNSLQALSICIGISIAISIVLFAAMSKPLSAFIRRVCPEPESVGFWLRFTVVMLFLCPLFITFSFGLPPASVLNALDVGELVQRAITASLVGSFLAMIGMGIWVSSLARRALPTKR